DHRDLPSFPTRRSSDLSHRSLRRRSAVETTPYILVSRVELDCSEWAGCPERSQDVQVGFGKQSRIQSSPGASVGHSRCGGGGRNGVQFGRDNGQGGGASCSTPRSAVAKTQYGKVRGYVEDGVLTFKGVPYGANTGGENRWLPAKPPSPWDGEYPALTYGANCPQRLHTWTSEQTFLYQWTDGWQSEDMLKVNIWTPSLAGKRPVMFYIHGGGFTFGSAY